MHPTPDILIIGASRGIGAEFVRQYRADGAAVSATVRHPAAGAALQELGAQVLLLDVANAAQTSTLAAQINGRRFGLVIYNAGVFGPRSADLETPELDEFDAVMHTNVLGAMRVLPQLADALAPGAVVAVLSSRMGSIGERSNGSAWLYRASKAAVNSVLKDASFAYAGRAICVALHPGWVRTDMGGAGADLAVEDSVAALRRTLAGLKPADNGRFFDHDGTPIAW